jgi:hypothetical protein
LVFEKLCEILSKILPETNEWEKITYQQPIPLSENSNIKVTRKWGAHRKPLGGFVVREYTRFEGRFINKNLKALKDGL